MGKHSISEIAGISYQEKLDSPKIIQNILQITFGLVLHTTKKKFRFR